MPQTGSCGAEQEGAATIFRTESSGEMWTDALDWITLGRTRRSCLNPEDREIRGNVYCSPGLDNPRRIKQEEAPPPRLDRQGKSGGLTLQTGSPGAVQERIATNPRIHYPEECLLMPQAGLSGGRSHDSPDWIGQGKVGAGSHAVMRTTLWSCNPAVMTTRPG